MLSSVGTVVYGVLVDFISNTMNEDVPKETPSPSPVPQWEQPPPAPEVTYNWVEVTDEFEKACNELDLGELVHAQHFGLFEAMSAIEMMDPKMDVGMIGKHATRKVLTFKQSVEEKNIKLNNLVPEELIVIMDTCQACILSWIEGQSLAQTVFTCLYLHDPYIIEDRCLKAFCIGVLKVCDMIKDKIYKANVFEEEDFQTLTYGFRFATNVTELRVVGMLKEAEDDLSRTIRTTKSNEQNDLTNAHKMSCLQGVFARIKFLRLFLQAIVPFGKKEMDVVQGSKKLLIQMSEQLEIINKTIKLGVPPITTEDGHEVSIGFEPLVNQRLLPPTFPRYTKLKSRYDLLPSYSDIIKKLLAIIEMSNFTSFQSTLDFIVTSSQCNPCVFTRSVLQIVFMADNRKVFGSHLLSDVLKESMRSFNAPPSFSPRYHVLQNNSKAKDVLDAFLARATRTINKLVQAYGHNYARQREKLAAILEDLAILQDDADRCDTDLQTIIQSLDPNTVRSHLTCFGSWTLHHILRVMTQYVLSGFQLELYSEHEYHYVYWYLAEVLLSWQMTTLNRAEGQLQRDETLNEQMQSSKSRSHKKAKKNKKKSRLHAKELLLVQGMQMMSAGTFKVMLGFFLDGKLKTPDCEFDNEATRYEHRFQPFLAVSTPPFMPYKQFREMTDVTQYYPPPSSRDLYMSSSKHFEQAKALYEKMAPSDETQQLLLVAKTNIVVGKLLAGGHTRKSTTKPGFDFSAHPVFPIIRVT
uniref:N-alpha-acetyltransferase 35, NatC auxiliary subunit n=1 Tax=Phallusia mammillata TaxID=59560 RepID=A0A6F9DL61_9ASCI|nr:N-alpha-acetyltransferase 35, NatC auxiliary subunit-like [Phallusia mammillata]